MADYMEKNEFQKSRAFSPAVTTQGGRIVWLAGQTGGRDDQGRTVPDGVYRVRLTLRREGRAVFLPKAITVDDRPLPRSGFGQTELAGIVTYAYDQRTL